MGENKKADCQANQVGSKACCHESQGPTKELEESTQLEEESQSYTRTFKCLISLEIWFNRKEEALATRPNTNDSETEYKGKVHLEAIE